MKKLKITIPVLQYADLTQLSEPDRVLLEKAREAAKTAYAPYSGFSVGAAVRLANGIVVTGNNQENAAYPSGLCAERVAVFYASSQYPDVPIEAVAVTARTKVRTISEPVSPCGACRQVLTEYETLLQHPIRIILAGETGPVVEFARASDLLPMNFTSKDL